MATEAGELIIKIGADVEQMKDAFKQMSDKLGSTATESVIKGNLIADALKEMGRIALSVAKDSIMAWGEQELAVTRLSGAVGTDAAQSLARYADELQQSTIYSHESIIAIQTQLANYGLLPGSIREATQAIVDFASRTGKDLPDATNTFTQALGGNSRQLRQMGLQILETDDRATRMNKTIDFMNQNFHGAAEEIKNTTLGSIDNLKNRINDLEERIGKLLLPTFQKLENVIGTVVDWMEKLTGATYANATATQQQLMVLDRHQQMVKQALQGHIEYRNTLQQELGVQNLSDEKLRELMVTYTNEIKLLKEKEKQQQKTSDAGAKGIKQVTTAEEDAVEARISALKKELAVNEETYVRIDELVDLTTKKKIADSEMELHQMMADQHSQTVITELETQKRMLQSQASYEANASFSDQLTVKLNDNISQSTAAWVDMSVNMINSFGDSIGKMIVEGQRFRDVIKEFWKNLAEQVISQIARMIAQWLVFQAMTGGGGGGFGRIFGGMASGGMINEPSIITGMRSGRSHYVGEAGPEMVVPAASGTGSAGANTPFGPGEGPGGSGSGSVTINISGQFIEGNAAKWQKFVREQIVPQVRRYTMSNPVGPFNRKRGAS